MLRCCYEVTLTGAEIGVLEKRIHLTASEGSYSDLLGGQRVGRG